MADVLVDTSIWSLALRRKNDLHDVIVSELSDLIRETRVRIIGPIRQEVLSGVKELRQFRQLRNRLRSFPDLEIHEKEFERAAEIFNRCRSAGIQGSNTDFLICSTAEIQNLSVFTTDQDFLRYQKVCNFDLHQLRQS